MMSLDERLDKAEEMIQKPSFRENKGLGNEVGYYIFDLKKTGGEYKREKKNDGNMSDIMKKNGRYLIE